MSKNRRTIGKLFIAAGYALAASGACSHDVTSPELSIERLAPELICNAQFPEGGLTVLIRGNGFTPLPVQTLEEPAALELPSVELQRARELDGSEVDGDVTNVFRRQRRE